MRPDDLPPIPTVEDLSAAVQKLIDGVNDSTVAYGVNADSYGKCVEAMARAAYLAHDAVASALHVTGFQHSMSSLMAVGLIRGIKGPYMIVQLDTLLYPQYDKRAEVNEWLDSDDVRTWLADEAQIKLASDNGFATESVIAHWKALVANRPTPQEGNADAE